MKCKYCQKQTINPKFCSRSCSASFHNQIRKNDINYRLKLSQTLKNSLNIKRAIIETRYCLCGKSFTCKEYKKKKFCSQSCINKYLVKPKAPGGYRLGSGRSKSGFYKGVYCGSTYELCWVIYNLDHDIKFSRFNGYLTDGNIKYVPDFILPDNTIIEIKGYHTSDVDKKTNLAISLGYKIKVLYKQDLEYIFTYVKKQYNTSNFATLYDNYKPRYKLTCYYCQAMFDRSRKIKTKKYFCSRSCCGKYMKSIRAKGS